MMVLCFLLGTDLNCINTPDFFSIFAKKLLKYCNFCHNIWQIKNRIKINIKMNAAICVEPSHIVIWIESPTQISSILFFSSCFLLKHWVCMEAWHSVMKLQHLMGKLVIKKTEQEKTGGICRPEKDGKESGFSLDRNLWFNWIPAWRTNRSYSIQ